MEGMVAIWLFLAVCALLMLGYPVAFTLAGTAIYLSIYLVISL